MYVCRIHSMVSETPLCSESHIQTGSNTRRFTIPPSDLPHMPTVSISVSDWKMFATPLQVARRVLLLHGRDRSGKCVGGASRTNVVRVRLYCARGLSQYYNVTLGGGRKVALSHTSAAVNRGAWIVTFVAPQPKCSSGHTPPTCSI